MKTTKVVLMVSAIAMLGGCAVVPVGSGYYAAPSAYYTQGPAYYGSPGYYGPSVGIGVYGGWHGGRGGGWR